MVSHVKDKEPSDPWIARLRVVLDDRAALLAQLESATLRQEEMIAAHDAIRLVELLTDRQTIVERFVAGQPELLELTGALEERIASLPAIDAGEIRRRVREISEGLTRITERDEAAQVELRRARDQTRAELERNTLGAGARAAYGSKPRGPRTMFADRKA